MDFLGDEFFSKQGQSILEENSFSTSHVLTVWNPSSQCDDRQTSRRRFYQYNPEAPGVRPNEVGSIEILNLSSKYFYVVKIWESSSQFNLTVYGMGAGKTLNTPLVEWLWFHVANDEESWDQPRVV